ncbi:MAG TPA: glycoside hydrolase 100 family protein, partial [Anaerolineales bacterium]|nr:glycoside hydrolase 100 family protein [Anaerolineales bacterium]
MVPVEEIKKAAIQVLLNNVHGPFEGLPRTAGWGYPEPYTRDWMIAALGILVTQNEELIAGLQRTLEALAHNQTRLGHIPSLAHDPSDRGASDTTPLFLIALALYRSVTNEKDFLEDAAQNALNWLQYQSPDDAVLAAQQPTSDWRDELWVWGYGLYVNALIYACLRLYGQKQQAQALRALMNRVGLRRVRRDRRIHEGLSLAGKPYYAFWVYKVHSSQRFDLLGNCLAILFDLADPLKAKAIIDWVESACQGLQAKGDLACDLPPCLIPFILPEDEDWQPRYTQFNQPGEYHNGGIWPFISAFYVAALVHAGQHELALKKFNA